MNHNITHNGDKITVIREFGEPIKFCVCQGDSWVGKGLTEKYKEFDLFQDASNYFEAIKKGV